MTDFSEYSKVFFWNFKRMDNVNYNFKIIEYLISSSTQNPLLIKPIIILLVSIIECILYDFLCRVQEHKQEKISNISEEDIQKIKDSQLPNKLGNFCEICKKYEFIGDKQQSIYDKICSFSNIRNRIHIQNSKRDHPLDEEDLWDLNLLKSCGSLFKEICIYMCNNYSRPEHISGEIPKEIDFPEPWNLIS